MYLPEHRSGNENRSYINAFGGYNHNPVIAESEFFDMKNMTADKYPLLAPREPRNYKLRVASDEYIDTDFELRTEYWEESLSKIYVKYIVRFPIQPYGSYSVKYTVNDEYVEEYTEKINFLGNGVKLEVRSAKEVMPGKGHLYAEATITAYKKPGVEWNEEDIGLYVRDIRVVRHNDTIQGMILKDGKLAYMIKNNLYWNGHKYEFEAEEEEKQQLVSFGAYILIFPLGAYLNTQDIADYGMLGAKSECENIVYSASDIRGAAYEYTAGNTAPSNPQDGQYWMRTGDEDTLYRWSENTAMWVAVGTTYVKIKADSDIFNAFDVGDGIHIENASVKNLNGVNTIAAKGDNYIVVTGILPQETNQEGRVKFERRIPSMRHVCVSGNRVWGCSSDESLNEIYACKLGDPKNWHSFQGTAIDSYAVSLGDDGEFTGACAFQGYPMFFKENHIYKVYGSYPAAYQLAVYDCRGIQKGSERSIAIVDEYLVYKSNDDICVFNGSYPRSISEKLGREKYTQCAAGSCGGKYYASMKDEDGEYSVFVYDFRKNLWVRDEMLQIEEFAGSNSGELYARTPVGIIGFGRENHNLGLKEIEEPQEDVEWFAEFGVHGLDSPDKKFVKEIKIRAAIDFGARLKVEVYYDDSGVWNEYWITKGGVGGDGKIRTYEIPIIPVRCDTMKMRLSGIGKSEIYSISREIEGGGR